MRGGRAEYLRSWLGLGICIIAATARANYLQLSLPTDTIAIPANTLVSDAFTIEARIKLISSLPPQIFAGRIFQEQRDTAEDKSLGISSLGRIEASMWTDPDYELNGALIFNAALVPDQWHHVALVRDGSAQRLYVNGVLAASNTVPLLIGNAPDSVTSIGGFEPPVFGAFRPAFLGGVDTLRISSAAIYSGDSFTPPGGDLPVLPSTEQLYNFNEPIGNTTVQDDGPAAIVGTLGIGYFGATSPTLINFIPGDANGDGKVDITDLGVLATNWQASAKLWGDGDFDGNGLVDITDLGTLATHWQEGVPVPPLPGLGQSAPSVPDPAMIAGVVPVLLLSRRRRSVPEVPLAGENHDGADFVHGLDGFGIAD